MTPVRSQIILLDLWDWINYELNSLERRRLDHKASDEECSRWDILTNAQYALRCTVQDNPLHAQRLATVLVGARELWNLPELGRD